MNTKTFILSVIVIYFQISAALADDTGLSARVEGTIYSYREDDTPAVFFFPPDKARWDGNKVTMKEWYTLTELQKEKFIDEYIEYLKGRYDKGIEVLGLDYLKALNMFSFYSGQKTDSEPSAKIVDRMLVGQGKIPEDLSADPGRTGDL